MNDCPWTPVNNTDSDSVWGKKLINISPRPPVGFEMPGNDDSWYACLVEQGRLWVNWLYAKDLCKAL